MDFVKYIRKCTMLIDYFDEVHLAIEHQYEKYGEEIDYGVMKSYRDQAKRKIIWYIIRHKALPPTNVVFGLDHPDSPGDDAVCYFSVKSIYCAPYRMTFDLILENEDHLL
jgi:hypothetical protein